MGNITQIYEFPTTTTASLEANQHSLKLMIKIATTLPRRKFVWS